MAATTIVTTTVSKIPAPTRVYGQVEASRSGIWVGIFAIIMSFAALTSALLVRQGSGELRVVARTSSFAFKNKLEDVRKIGQALNVAQPQQFLHKLF